MKNQKKTVGGKRPGAGRPKGAVNKVTANIRALAQEHGKDALEILVKIAKTGENETARISAAKEILDRAYGKATAHLEHSGPDGGPITEIRHTIVDPKNDRNSAP
ncbi:MULTISPECIES: hypothetical protein [unclassified Saccharibacter]|uniref:hypothetical protein n=1 Tax=unclassified Saccharibacter TaxID=2648722 RepID=UPI001322173A|nr:MULTISPECIES: hypothetical protein [unclassified Saccharibacter]MXV35956.1 hypothetical protein [Saccharibacter sp. EH611]MXV58390.1 hypothetical protein [Saccharibacter sp. EH70]MXV65898.1 hypothetical protein [Saccharibacter sp. EH60]MXV65941.1 hypothetical protein [Saccharibacter sp. EH60]